MRIRSHLPYLGTLSTCLEAMAQKGYLTQFKVTEQGLMAVGFNKQYSINEVSIVNHYRFEGASDPSDKAIMYTIETTDGRKGTLVDIYGGQADPLISNFVARVRRFQQQN